MLKITSILICFLAFTAFAGQPVQTGELISANRFNNQTFGIGDIKQSLLNLSQFQQQFGDCWVLIDGRDVSGSDYASITGKNTLPDARGRFARNEGGNSAPIGTIQNDSTAINGLNLNDPGHSHNFHAPMYHQAVGTYYTNIDAAGNGGIAQVHNTQGSVTGISIQSSDIETRPDNFTVNMFIKINHACN